MRKLFRGKLHFCLRALLLCGVLTGLLFSGGEGIRLLPFPAAAAGPPGAAWKLEKGSDYQKNVHRFENQQGSYQSKSQRSHPHHWWDQAPAFYLSPKSLAAAGPEKDFPTRPRIFRSLPRTENGGSRAPPFSL
jgi:hypothetical protein